MLAGLNPVHLIIILAIVILLFGPSRLTGAGKAVGESLKEFKKSMSDPAEQKTEPEKVEATAKEKETEKEEKKEKVEA